MNKIVRRLIGAILIVDGLLTFVFGKKFIHIFLSEKQKNFYQKFIKQLLALPAWQLRGAAAIETGIGLTLLGKSSLKVPTFYKLVAKGYAAIDPGWREWFYRQAHQQFDQAISIALPQNGKILDLGCGVGANVSRLIALELPYSSYTGVDLTPEMLQYAKNRYDHFPNIAFQQLNLISDPLPEGPYDLIISTWVLEHLPHPAQVVEKAWEHLQPGGRMVLLFEAQADSLLSRIINQLYPLFSAKLVAKSEYRNFPGEIILKKHFPGPLGDLALLVLEKPEMINEQRI